MKEYWFPLLTATSPILQETAVGKTWLQLELEEATKTTGLEKLISQTAALYVFPVLSTVAVIVRFGSPTLISALLVAKFTAARLDAIVVLESGAFMLSWVRPTLEFTGLPLMVAAPLMVMLLSMLGVAAPLTSKITAKVTGAPFTLIVEGEKRQETPAGKFPQLGVMTPARLVGVIFTVTGWENELLTIVNEAGDGVPREKLGAGTIRVRGCVWLAEAPPEFPVAVTVRAGLPALVLKGTDVVTDTSDGKLLTVAGEKLHAPPGGKPAVQAKVTVPGPGLLKFALAVRCVVAALETFPAPMVMLPGEKAEALNCTTCNVSG